MLDKQVDRRKKEMGNKKEWNFTLSSFLFTPPPSSLVLRWWNFSDSKVSLAAAVAKLWIKRSHANVEGKYSSEKYLCREAFRKVLEVFAPAHSKSICGWSLPLYHYYELTPITRHSIKEIWKQKQKSFKIRFLEENLNGSYGRGFNGGVMISIHSIWKRSVPFKNINKLWSILEVILIPSPPLPPPLKAMFNDFKNLSTSFNSSFKKHCAQWARIQFD